MGRRMIAALAVAMGMAGGGAALAQAPAKPAPKYTAEQIEQMKRENAKAMAENALITQAVTAMNAKNWAAALDPLNQLIAGYPQKWEFHQALGEASYNLGRYEEAAEAYKKALLWAPTTADPKMRSRRAAMLVGLGNASLKLKRNADAVAAFEQAASLDPNPGVAYFNLCATMYNTGNVEGALRACDRSIAADPTRADAYFIKGSLMLGDAKMGANNQLVAPPGTEAALKKYLELQPNGAHAEDVRQMLAAIGAKVTTTYEGKK